MWNKGTYYESAINFRWIPELKRIVLTAANQEYTFSDGPFAGVMDSYYVNSRGIDLIYNNISLNSTNCFTITASDFSTVFGYQTSPWALQGANSSHNYSFVPQWISKYGTLINLYGGLRDPITHQGSTNFYFITKPVGRMTIPYSTTTSRVFNIENNVDISGNITAIKYYGDGSQLTGIDALPDQSGNSGKLLISDGSNAIWSSDINDGLKISGAIYDNTNNKGTNGQVLQSNGTTWNWATPITSNDISNAIAALVDSAPDTLNTLNELAAALGDDTNFSTTITNSLATKLNIANSHDITNVTAGTVRASSAVVVDANKDITGYRNVTATAFYGDGSNLTGISSVTSLDDLSDCKVEGTNFTESIKIGSSSTGILSNAVKNTIIGIGSGNNISSGNHHTLLGHQAGQNLTSGSENTFIGVDAGQMATTANWNTCIGSHAADQLVGNQNTIVGRSTARQLNGNWVTCLGAGAGRYMNDSTPSEHVTVIGARCGYDIRGVSNCVILGAGPISDAAAISDWSNGHGSNTVTIGMDAISNTYLKGNIHIGTSTIGNSNVVYTLPGTAGTAGQILKFPSSTTTINNNATYLLEWGEAGPSLTNYSDASFNNLDISGNINTNRVDVIGTTNSDSGSTDSSLFNIRDNRTASGNHNHIFSIRRPNSDTDCLILGNNANNQPLIIGNNADIIFGNQFTTTFTENMRLSKNGELNVPGSIGVGTSGFTISTNGVNSYVGSSIHIKTGSGDHNYTNISDHAVSLFGGYNGANLFSGSAGLRVRNNYIFSYGNVGSPNVLSDDRYKSRTVDCTLDALSLIRQVQVREFEEHPLLRVEEGVEDTDLSGVDHHFNVGVVAQELEQIPGFEWLVTECKDGIIEGDTNPTKSVNYGTLNIYLLKAVQQLADQVLETKELDTIVQTQENEINELKTKVSSLESENTILKSKLNEILSEMGKETI